MNHYERTVQEGGNLLSVFGELARVGAATSPEEHLRRLARARTDAQRDAIANEAFDRPWRWLASVSEVARDRDSHLLAARIFAFSHYFRTSLWRECAEHAVSIGMGLLDRDTFMRIAEVGRLSAAELDDEAIIFQDDTGCITAEFISAMYDDAARGR